MTATISAAEAGQVGAPSDSPAANPLPHRLLVGGVVATLVAGVVLRLIWSGPLWLDEAQSVAISKLPLHQLFAALRRDGSPPLYYLLLHVWIMIFGDSTLAVRALSSIFALATLPVGYIAVRRLAGKRTAMIALVLLASNPFAIRYATETRMYALELLLVLIGAIVVPRALEEPSLRRLAPVTLITALLAYTHYWAFYLLVTVAVMLLMRRRYRVVVAMALAVVPFLPWAPSFVFQILHTGTPWASKATPSILVDTILQWGGPGWVGALLAVATLTLAFLGLVGRAKPDGKVELDPASTPLARRVAALYAGPLVVALLAAVVVTSGYAIRYTSVVLPFFIMLMALGLTLLRGRWQPAVVAVVVLAGLVAGAQSGSALRTEAGVVAAAISLQSHPGDVVGFCPDQLGPAVSRLLPSSLRLTESSFADSSGPSLVNWVNYAKRMKDDSTDAYAQQLLGQRTAGGTIWLVVANGYRTLGSDCSQISGYLTAVLGPPVTVVATDNSGEPSTLLAFAPAG